MIQIRETAPSEQRQAAAAFRAALLKPAPDDEQWRTSQESWSAMHSLSAWQDERCVGHVGAYPFDTQVPGGAWLPTSGVTRVGILPTHRRRGLARDLLTRLLREARERGQHLASLRASETAIYGRYGFGLAGWQGELRLDPVAARPVKGAVRGGSFRLLAPEEVLETVARLYDDSPRAPGTLRRPDWLWRRYFENAFKLGSDAAFVVVHSAADDTQDGYASYSVTWSDDDIAGTGTVDEVYAHTPGAELALWNYLCDIDLVRSWTASERPVDDVLRFACRDPRAYRTTALLDEQWLRLLDVDAALTARSYAEVDGAVTIGVHDPLFDDNNGVWHLSVAGAVRDDAAEPALRVDVRTLAALYLGGQSWRRLAAIGELGGSDGQLPRPGDLATADRLFVTERAPHCGSGF